jgi:hypothetical protein
MPSHKKAAKRRLDKALPTNSGEKKNKSAATFRNPGNKAGQGMDQQMASAEMMGAPSPDAGNSGGENFIKALMSASPKKSKTRVQPAASRKIQLLKMAAKK